MNADKGFSPVESRDAEVEFDPFKPVSYRHGGGGVAWLALLMVLGLVAWNGWQWWQGQRGERAAQVTGVQLDRLANALDASSQRLNALEMAVEEGNALATRLEQLEAASRDGASSDAGLKVHIKLIQNSDKTIGDVALSKIVDFRILEEVRREIGR